MSDLSKPPARGPLTPARIVAVILLVIAAAIGGVVIEGDGPGGPPATTPTAAATTPAVTKVDADGDGKRDDTVKVDPAAAAELDQALAGTTPAGDPASELAEPLREKTDTGPAGVLTGPLAADELEGCRTRFVQNFSQRTRKIEVGVFHQTVSLDRPGYSDQDALTALANRRSSGVSWAAQVGGTDGLCTYNVPFKYKAWTQGSANSIAVGVEVNAYGTEPRYCSSKCRTTLVRIMRTVRDRYGVPLRRGLVRFNAACVPIVVRKGWIEHADLGSCGGGHVDVSTTSKDPKRIAAWSTAPIITAAAAGTSAAAKARAKVCGQLRYHRRKMKTTTGKDNARQVDQIKALKKKGRALGLAIGPPQCS